MRFEQRQEQVVRVAPDQDGFTVIVANELASTDKRFCDPFDGASTRLVFKPICGYFLSFLSGARERRVCLPELVNTSPAGVRDSDCGCHTASVGKGLQKATLPLLGEFELIHQSPITVGPAIWRLARLNWRAVASGHNQRGKIVVLYGHKISPEISL
jgi:hypothetical protein